MTALLRFDIDARLWTVSELTEAIRLRLSSEFAEVGLRGEVSNVSRPPSGHVYFSIKDGTSQIKAVLWRNAARKLVFDLANGLAVRAFGGLDVYAPRGDYQLIVREIEPEGIGALELAFQQLFARLSAEGLFEPGRKRPLPRFPRRIVVVTSPSGAAVRDFLRVVGRRWPGAEILIAPTLVQGPGASAQIVEAIALANRVPDADFLVLTRGGGSLEDLWAFNEEPVARAIFGSRLPVVSAIGHEIDVTISDLVADLRASTPSVAGEICVPDLREVRAALDGLRLRLARATAGRVAEARAQLDDLSARAGRALTRSLDDRRRDLARLAAQLEALSPLGVLARGYSLTLRAEDGAVIRSTDAVGAGEMIVTRLASGSLVSRVERVEPSPS